MQTALRISDNFGPDFWRSIPQNSGQVDNLALFERVDVQDIGRLAVISQRGTLKQILAIGDEKLLDPAQSGLGDFKTGSGLLLGKPPKISPFAHVVLAHPSCWFSHGRDFIPPVLRVYATSRIKCLTRIYVCRIYICMTLDEFLKSENAKAIARGKPKMTDYAFGLQVGLSQAHVNRLRNGKSLPSWEVAAKIAGVTKNKVTANDWYTEAAQ